MRQVLCIWVLSCINENDDLFSCEIFTRKWNISHETESCHIRMSRVWYTWVMSHMDGWLMCERCARRCAVRGGSRGMWHFKCKWVTSHMNASCRIRLSRVTYEWVMSHTNELWRIWMNHGTYKEVIWHMNQSITYQCYIWMEPCLICESHVIHKEVILVSRHS